MTTLTGYELRKRLRCLLAQYEISMRFQVEKENEKFIQLINKTISILSQKEKNNIFNNYQLISYQENFIFI